MANAYNPQGQAEWWFVDSVAGITNPAAPTAAQINAGIPLAMGIRTITPPSTTANTIDVTPLGAKAPWSASALPGIQNAQLVLNSGDTADSDMVQLFGDMNDLVGTTGWLVGAPRGRVGRTDDQDGQVATGDLVHVYPATVAAVGNQDNNGGAGATWRIDFTHQGAFHENVTVAAS